MTTHTHPIPTTRPKPRRRRILARIRPTLGTIGLCLAIVADVIKGRLQ